jgi:hypothetical protein
MQGVLGFAFRDLVEGIAQELRIALVDPAQRLDSRMLVHELFRFNMRRHADRDRLSCSDSFIHPRNIVAPGDS